VQLPAQGTRRAAVQPPAQGGHGLNVRGAFCPYGPGSAERASAGCPYESR